MVENSEIPSTCVRQDLRAIVFDKCLTIAPHKRPELRRFSQVNPDSKSLCLLNFSLY